MNIQLPRLLIVELIIIATGIIVYFASSVLAQFELIALILAFSLLLTYALLPAVNRLSRYVRRGLAILVVYVTMFAVVAWVATLLSVPLARQVEQLAQDYPRYSDQFREAVPNLQEQLHKRRINVDLVGQADRTTQRLEESTGDIVAKSGAVLAKFFGTISIAVVVLFVSIYFLHSGKSFIDETISWFPKKRQRLVRRLTKDYDRIIGSFVRGQLLIAVITALVIGLFAALIGLPYSVIIGFVAGLTGLIPVIGALLGVILPVIIALFVKPIAIPIFLIFFVLFNEVSDKILRPHIVGKAVDLHPLLVFLGVLAGLQVAGITGALLATPVIAMAKVTLVALGNSAGYVNR